MIPQNKKGKVLNMNKAILIGRLTRDPETSYSKKGDGISCARFTLAVDRRVKDSGTDFIPVVTFGKTAEFAEKYLTKGIKVSVVGRIQTGNYTDQKGNTHYTTDVIAEEVEFCESKKRD